MESRGHSPFPGNHHAQNFLRSAICDPRSSAIIWKPALRGEGLNLELPKFNHKFKANSVTYSLTKLWNSFPSQVRLSSDGNDFRSKLHDCRF